MKPVSRKGKAAGTAIDRKLEAARRLHEAGRLTEAEAVYDEILAKNAHHQRASYLKGIIHLGRRRLGEAHAALLKATVAFPDDSEVWNNLANCLRAMGRHDAAVEAYDKAIILDPMFAGVYANRARTLRQLGRLDEAEQGFRQALSLNSGMTLAYNGLSRCGASRLTNSDVESLENLLSSGQLRGDSLAEAAYALGKHFDETGDYDRAFKMYRRGNSVKRGAFDDQPLIDELVAIQELYDQPDRLPKTKSSEHGQKRDQPFPIFICGMPRTGTTLVEQILSAHPGVTAHGETNLVEKWVFDTMKSENCSVPGVEWPKRLQKPELPELAGIIRNIPKMTLETPEFAFVDKSLFNDRFIAPILAATPDARFVVCHRDYRDASLSIYFTDFTKARPFATDLRWITKVYDVHARRIDHWRKIMGDALIEVTYETLVREPEPEIRRLLGALDLPWADTCLQSHDSARAVTTPSDWQVRRPINRDSLQRWKNYEPWLGDIFSGRSIKIDNP